MNKNMKTIIISIMLLAIACAPEKQKVIDKEKKTDLTKFSDSAYQYCIKKNFNKNFYFLVNLKEHSGHKRFYVWDFTKNKPVDTFMVSHGCGNNMWKTDYTKCNPVISNKLNSHCSSVGKYVIEERGCSSFGIGVKYNLTGLDKTNNNARRRAIVLHSWEEVTDYETYPYGTPEGWGCPAVSNNSMRQIDKMLKANDNTLMWIIN